MKALLAFARGVDRLNGLLGQGLGWLLLAAVLISAGNAIARKAFDLGSNAYLEAQWYLFSAVFLLGAGYVLLRNAHVRIDVIANRLSPRTNAWIDLLGLLLFTLPLCCMLVLLSWPVFERAWVSGEVSQNAGGLLRWPALLMIPAGFTLLGLQALAELVKRVAFLRGQLPQPFVDLSAPAAPAAAAQTPGAGSGR